MGPQIHVARTTALLPQHKKLLMAGFKTGIPNNDKPILDSSADFNASVFDLSIMPQ
jgi:hypothetical protein